jgi:hypothetical protein
MLGNSALAASCWAGDDENVVVGCDGHFVGLGSVQDRYGLGW